MNKISAFFAPGGSGYDGIQRVKHSLGISATTPVAKPNGKSKVEAERTPAQPPAPSARKIPVSEIFHQRLVEAECFYELCMLDTDASAKIFAADPQARKYPVSDDRAYGRVIAALPAHPGRQTTVAELEQEFGYNPCSGLTDGLHPGWAMEQMRDAAYVCRENIKALSSYVATHPGALSAMASNKASGMSAADCRAKYHELMRTDAAAAAKFYAENRDTFQS